MREDSPFSPDRFEYERRHIYYLPPRVFERLEMSKPTYVIGSRGTGKTTLLHALNWKERLDNESLRLALEEDVFKKQYIGIYLRMPHFRVASFEKWLKECDDDIRGPIFGLFLDIIWIELASEALSEFLVREDEFKASPAQEHELVESVFKPHPEIVRFTNVRSPCSLKQFARAIRNFRGDLEKFASLRVDPKEVCEDYILGEVGDLGRSISELLVDFCNASSSRTPASWHFKVCIDEAECLSAFQQRVVNTIVRLSKRSAVYVISYVSKVEDIVTTLSRKMSLQRADRELIILDDISNREFENLAEGVASVRVRYRTGQDSTIFDTRRVLGGLNINLILKEIIETSESAEAKRLIAKAEEFAKTPFYRGVDWASKEESECGGAQIEAPPIYQAYIIERLGLRLASPNDEKWKRRSQESREIRKRMVAAYLCICRLLRTEPRYAFAEMVFRMSDNCIRDFLAQMHQIYIEANKDPVDFMAITRLPIRQQDKALKRASREKRDSLPQSGITAPIEVGRIVDGLARVTAIIQSQGPDNKPLLSSERGRFVIDTQYAGASQQANLEFLRDANEAGFLRIRKSEAHHWELQVHCSLAAAYGFSYRGAYYQCRLSLADVNRLCTAEHTKDFNKIVGELATRLSGDTRQMLLFEGPDQ